MTLPVSKIALYLFLFTTVLNSFGQKLPNVQETGVRAPFNIRIDGKDLEWNNRFQAHNTNTDILYTICNDDENLYLVAQISNQAALTKIMAGGLTFIVQKSNKKTNKGGISLTYPAFDKGVHLSFSLRSTDEFPPPPDMTAKIADSVMKMNNNKISAKAKFIRINGMKDIDTLLSIFNQDGVRAAGYFDNKKVYICEISVSLKNLGLSINDSQKFLYHLLLNGGPNKYMGDLGNNTSGASLQDTLRDARRAITERLYSVAYGTTDFWGEYTLVKK